MMVKVNVIHDRSARYCPLRDDLIWLAPLLAPGYGDCGAFVSADEKSAIKIKQQSNKYGLVMV